MDAQTVIRETLSAIEAGDMAKAGSNMTDDFKFSGPVPQPIDKAEFLAMQGGLVAAMPNWKFNAKNYKVQGDKVTTAVHITATHSATLESLMPGMPAVPASGKKVSLPEEPVTFTMRGDKLASMDVTQVPGGGVPGIMGQIGVQLPH